MSLYPWTGFAQNEAAVARVGARVQLTEAFLRMHALEAAWAERGEVVEVIDGCLTGARVRVLFDGERAARTVVASNLEPEAWRARLARAESEGWTARWPAARVDPHADTLPAPAPLAAE